VSKRHGAQNQQGVREIAQAEYADGAYETPEFGRQIPQGR
jgi:hypothetical protein